MRTHVVIGLSAILAAGAGLSSGSAGAQQKSLKDQLIGTWTLVSWENTAANGTKRQLANPKGIFILDAGGRYAEVWERGDRPKFKNASQPTTEELAAATRDYFAANFGTWSVSEADKTLVVRVDGALRPNNEGTDAKCSIELSGDALREICMVPTGAKLDFVYRRAK
jgi:hypothetical protein